MPSRDPLGLFVYVIVFLVLIVILFKVLDHL